MNERNWIDIEPGESSFSAFRISKKVINLLRHSQTVQREDDGAIQFWMIKNYLQNQFPQTQYWSDDRWKAFLAAGGGAKRRYQHCTDISGTIIYFRSLQGHSGRNFIDPSLQDNVIIQSGFFQQIYHVGCAFNLHSITNNGLILEVKIQARDRQYSLCPLIPETKAIKILQRLTSINHVEHNTCTVHGRSIKTRYFGLILTLRLKKGLTFYQTRSNAIILQGTLPACCISKVVRLKTGEVLYEKAYMSPRPPPKISLRHDHDWTRGKVQLGSTVDQQTYGKVVLQSRGEVQHAKFSKPTQPKPKPICDRSWQLENTQDMFVVKGETSRSQKIDEKGFHEKLCASDGSGQPEITLSVIEARNLYENTRVEQTHDGSGQPEITLSVIEARNLYENTRVEQTHDGTGQLVEQNSSRAHTVKEQHAPHEHRDIASFNTNNEFNRVINEEDIDFNVPGVPHSTVKQLHGTRDRDLIHKIENLPNRHALQRDLLQSQSFNPFSQESKEMIHEVGNVELCELLDMEPKTQCKECLSYWEVGIVYCTCGHFLRNGTEENRNFVQYTMDLFSIPNYYLKKGRPHGLLGYPRPLHPR